MRILIFLLIIFLVDLYVFQSIKTVTTGWGTNSKRLVYILYWLMTAFAFALLIAASIKDWHTWPKFIRTYGFSILLVIFASKILVLPFLLIDDIIRVVRWAANLMEKPLGVQDEVSPKLSRSHFLAGAGLILASIPFTSLTYGMIKGPYDFKVRRKKLYFKNLPDAFHGLKVLQISDLHTGSWSGPATMQRAVDLIMKQNADLILFTGDLVNDMGEEAFRFVNELSQLKAPLGVYSSLGNHDYGDYVQWESPDARKKNFEVMLSAHKKFGWHLLRNENISIKKGNDKIALAGCENWGKRFQKYGNLNLTLKGIDDNTFTILMSHDPSHWDAEIIQHPHKVDLTLAGHTHGMQFGVDFEWFKWSPVQYVYKQWADLYNHENKYLYVNRGIGFIGYPGRVGIRPEITVLELCSDV